MKTYYKIILTASLTMVSVLLCGIDAPVVAAPTGSFSATYYDNIDFSNPVLNRTDDNIDFVWGEGSPDPVIAPDTFSARWEGNFTFEQANYTFSATADDGVRLYVDQDLVIDEWRDQAPTTYTVTLSMTAGTHLIEMEYYERGEGATAKLSWAETTAAPTPADDTTTTPPPPTGTPAPEPKDNNEQFHCNLFNDTNLSEYAATEIHKEINFDWGIGTPNTSVAPDTFSARWVGNFTFEQGEYEFSVTSDDGVRLYVDGDLIIDQWVDQGPTTKSAKRNMTAGSAEVKMEYYEKDGGAMAKLSWYNIVQVTLPFAKGEHPRIIITKDDIAALAEKVDEKTDPLYPKYKIMKDDVFQAISNNWKWHYIPGIDTYQSQGAVVSAAFVYLIENHLHPETSAFYANGVKQVLMNSNPDSYTTYSRHLRSYAVAYDWVYNGLSPADRKAIGNRLMESYALQRRINDTQYEEIWHIMMSNIPSCEWTYAAIAIWNETDLNGNADNSLSQKKLNEIRQFLVTKKLLLSNMVGGGINPEGGYDDIGGSRQFALELYAWDKATGEDLWSRSRYLQDNLLTRLIAWKMYSDTFPMGICADFAFAGEYPIAILSKKDPTGIAQYLANEIFQREIKEDWKENMEQYRWIIFYDPTKPGTNYNTLPLARYDQGYNADGTKTITEDKGLKNGEALDAGWVFFRSGWTKDDTLIAFTSGDWFTAKQVYNVNAFCIYRSGDLAVMNNSNQSGGKTPGNPHNYTFQLNYGKPTVAVNSITVSDPDIAMDQGQELYQINSTALNSKDPYYWDPNNEKHYSGEYGVYPNETVDPYISHHYVGSKYYDRGDITKFETTSNYDYVTGNGTKAYHPERLTNFQRTLAFIDKKYLLILDRVTATKPEFVKRWYLHTIEEPLTPIGAVPLTDTSSTDGSTTWSQADFNNIYADSDPSGGRLFIKSLLPKGATYRKRGGKGYAFWRDKMNFAPEPGSPADGYEGDPYYEGRRGWRLEQDISGQKDDIFLNVLYPTDDTVDSMPETVCLSLADGNLASNNVVGAHIKDDAVNNVVLFSADPTGGVVKGDISYTIEPTAEIRHFIFDLDPTVNYDMTHSSAGNSHTFTIRPGSGTPSSGIEVLERSETGALVFTFDPESTNNEPPRYCSISNLK